MEIFLRLVLAHLLTDFTLQTNKLAQWKRESLWGTLLHTLVFLLLSLLFCWGNLTKIWISIGPRFHIYGWVAILLLTILHFLEDEWRIYSIQRFNAKDNLFFFLWDQFIHVSLIFVFSPIRSLEIYEKWVLVCILLVLGTHFATILLHYIEGGNYENKAVVSNDKKYTTILGRLFLMLLCTLSGYLWLVVFIIAVLYVFYQEKILKYSWIDTILGNAIAIVCGIFIHILLY
jgi:hypothetical protein